MKLATPNFALSQHQGLGFVLFGTVVDKRTFLVILIKMGALSSTVFMSLLAYRPKPHGTGTASCQMTQDQQDTIQRTLAFINATCTWNLTVGPGGVVVH